MEPNVDFESFVTVPGHSTAELAVDGDPKLFDALVEVVEGTGRSTIKESLLIPGPASVPLAPERTYFLIFDIAFLFDCELTLMARIRKPEPDGSTHSIPATWTVSGASGEVLRRGIYVRTEGEDGHV